MLPLIAFGLVFLICILFFGLIYRNKAPGNAALYLATSFALSVVGAWFAYSIVDLFLSFLSFRYFFYPILLLLLFVSFFILAVALLISWRRKGTGLTFFAWLGTLIGGGL